MGKKAGRRLPNFCLNRIRPLVRVRSPPQPIQSKSSDHVDENVQKCDQSGINIIVNADQAVKSSDDHQGVVKPTGLTIGRKIMIVVDSSNEAKAALQWSLSHHTVQSQDKLVLLHVIKPSNKRATCTDGESKTKTAPRACHEAVHSLKKICQQKRPEVELEVAVVEAMEKGPAIVEEARKQGAALLILGQRKRSMTWRLIMMWAGNRVAGGGGVVEYCIQNANCMAIAVRRKSNKQGGYLITTKRHKDFWLLA
ncbi:hypothetical protein LWI29_002832 [Acer saccharum]|uniref:UspA domain-containing protein n=1 Tax=Acer saccharum TaxID=4024 RepID=A0AA39VBK2_ACESA|nr:hypothetical protein LWI29_002832 [Acer saccharum]KAK1552125.1 hypothetical protein Q3G72_010741 [Acer saccharum]